ncbi:MAG: hypothetical protein NTW87_07230 [Planctomycetota bacterium]|nr:hypothetical protein [Planctomycetota bacterium]
MKKILCWAGWLFMVTGMMAAAAADPMVPAPTPAPVGAANGAKVLSTRGFARTSVLSQSVGKEAITAYRFEIPYGLAAGWRLPYLGFSDGPTATGTIQVIGVMASVQEPGQPGRSVRITFGGQNGVKVAPSAIVESDPVDLPVSPGAVIVVWTQYRNQDPLGPLPFMTWGFVDRCDGCLVGDIGTLPAAALGDDAILRSKAAPPPLFAGQGALIRSYQPMFITGRPHPAYMGKVVSIGFIGDSINIATGDFERATPDDPFPARGWNGRACGFETPYVVFGQGGSNAGGFTSAQKTELFRYLFGADAGEARVTCLVDGYGINNLRQQTKTKAPDAVWRDRLAVAGVAHRLGLPYVQTTLTPMGDDWLDFDPELGERGARFEVFIAARNAFNRQVRKGSLEIRGCVGCIDWGQAVEMDPAAGDNRWQPGLTMDGIHPSTKGYQVMERVAANALRDLRPQLTR